MSTFFTTEISSPEFESDYLRWITVKSTALKRRADITLYVPPVAKKDMPLDMVILLHGVYGSHWAWAMKGGVHRTAYRLMQEGLMRPMVLVMPSDGLYGDGSGYLSHKDEDFEKWIAEDLIKVVREQIHVVNENSKAFITGLSMGGYGAMRLGAKHPDVFAAFSGHSSITEFSQIALFLERNDDRALSTSVLIKENVVDCILSNRKKLHPFMFDCGTEDSLLEFNRSLHETLLKNSIPHTYTEHPGGHAWEYWRKHVEDSLLFFNGFSKSLFVNPAAV